MSPVHRRFLWIFHPFFPRFYILPKPFWKCTYKVPIAIHFTKLFSTIYFLLHFTFSQLHFLAIHQAPNWTLLEMHKLNYRCREPSPQHSSNVINSVASSGELWRTTAFSWIKDVKLNNFTICCRENLNLTESWKNGTSSSESNARFYVNILTMNWKI